MADLVDYLRKNGPSHSAEMVDWLASAAKIGKETAQKRLSRLVVEQKVNKLDSIRLKNNSGFIYLPEQFNTERYWKRLMQVLKSERSPLFTFAMTVISIGGIVSLNELRSISAHPDHLTGKTDFMVFLANIIESQILVQIGSNSQAYQINSGIFRESNYSAFLSRQILMEFFLKGILEWFVINGLVYRRSIGTISDVEKYFLHYKFSFFGRSYVIGSNVSNENVFFVLDYLPNTRHLGIEEISYFVSKVESTRKLTKSVKSIPMIVANYFSPTALSELRKRNIVGTTVKNLLGDKVSEILEDLKNGLAGMVSEIEKNGNAFVELVKKVNSTFGMTDNLRAKLFEYFIATIMYYKHHLHFEVGKLVVEPRTYDKAEIDIIMMDGTRTIHIVECKAYTSNIDDDDIRIFLAKARKVTNWIRGNEAFRDTEILFHYYTLSDYMESATDLLATNKKYNIQTQSGQEIRETIRSFKEKDLSKTFEEFFI